MRSTRCKMKADRRRRWSVTEAQAILEDYRTSGLTQRAFVHGMGIGLSTLQFWLRRQARSGEGRRCEAARARTSPGVSLIEVELDGVGRHGSAQACYEIEWPNGTRLRVPRAFREEEVRGLLGMLKEVA